MSKSTARGKKYYRIVVNNNDVRGYVIMEVLDSDLPKYKEVKVKIDGEWYPALQRSR